MATALSMAAEPVSSRALQEGVHSDGAAITQILLITSVCYGLFFIGLAMMWTGFGFGSFRLPSFVPGVVDPEANNAQMLSEPQGKTPVRDMSEMWKKAFIRKVYAILGCQIFATVVIASVMMLAGGEGLVEYMSTDGSFLLMGAFIASIVNIFALGCYQTSHPTNIILLSSFTVLESVVVGFICAVYYASGMGVLVLEAFAITSIIFIGLTAFTIQSKIDFDFLAPFLFVAIFVLLIWGMFASLFAGSVGSQAYALFGVIIFALYVVYDTHLIVNRLDYDQAVVGAVSLYLDFINLFLFLLQLLSGGRR